MRKYTEANPCNLEVTKSGEERRKKMFKSGYLASRYDKSRSWSGKNSKLLM
ncbi:hypothetical protein SLEP1_g6290 [Rubroshorea leprosula]|uniref:Uncharacterized protein n=1 Tax=Rubroshorea leprosula TaxID=152421 RepID=A0AAV5HV09_9ROSI|nr:hypothetical protein SLEP1_g6290 [Rubroshorea leprosula]